MDRIIIRDGESFICDTDSVEMTYVLSGYVRNDTEGFAMALEYISMASHGGMCILDFNATVNSGFYDAHRTNAVFYINLFLRKCGKWMYLSADTHLKSLGFLCAKTTAMKMRSRRKRMSDFVTMCRVCLDETTADMENIDDAVSRIVAQLPSESSMKMSLKEVPELIDLIVCAEKLSRSCRDRRLHNALRDYCDRFREYVESSRYYDGLYD